MCAATGATRKRLTLNQGDVMGKTVFRMNDSINAASQYFLASSVPYWLGLPITYGLSFSIASIPLRRRVGIAIDGLAGHNFRRVPRPEVY